MKSKPDHDLNIIGDFLRYIIMLFVPFCIFGAIYGLINEFSFVSLVINPFIYSVGISLIIIVVSYDVNDILDLFGLAKKTKLGLHVKYSRDVQEISMLIGMTKYDSALKKVNILIKKEPKFAAAHNLRGEILLQGFQMNKEARQCFNTVLKLSQTGDEQYKLAEALKAESYSN